MPSSAFPITASRAAVLTLALGGLTALGGCTALGIGGTADAIDYRSGANRTPTLEVPPDLTPLSRDGRYQPQSGTVSATALAAGTQRPAVAAAPGTPSVAIEQAGSVRLERAGERRWIVTSQAPEQVWAKARQFWLDMGFEIARESAEAGTLETEWAQNRAKLPNDLIRRTVGSVLPNLFDTSERDRYMMRVERTSAGTEVYVSHRGLQEELVGRANEGQVAWVARPSEPQLEREMLTRLMVALGGVADTATTTAAAAGAGAAPAATPASAPAAGEARARVVSGRPGAALQVDDTLDRTWRRIGLALDRGGFTVEDRDRSQGLYFVRFVDTKEAAKDEPNFFTRWFSSDDRAAKALNRYRIQVQADGQRTLVHVQNYQGQPDNSASAQKIVSLLVDELKL
ncbi:outer membrane protein assembly factor BamC [Ideonella sp.]|uniref:outer membrane protein assembly factor BamC n=1 Tax=Ideonella sp. TaxID=1929293 RepID=UPI0035ADDB75